MDFEVIGPIRDAVTIAVGSGIKDQRRLRRSYGGRRWRTRKGTAKVRLEDDTIVVAKIHWYEAHGVGKREIKIIRLFEEAQ